MTDEICGYEGTHGDHPCQNPAGENGRCWIPSHNPDGDDENPGGRPSKLDDVREDILEAAQRGTTKEGCARAAGIHPSTLYDWLEEFPEFSEAFKRARARGEQSLVESAVKDDPKWVLERSYGYTKEQDVNIGGQEDGVPVEVELNETVVETGYDE